MTGYKDLFSGNKKWGLIVIIIEYFPEELRVCRSRCILRGISTDINGK